MLLTWAALFLCKLPIQLRLSPVVRHAVVLTARRAIRLLSIDIQMILCKFVSSASSVQPLASLALRGRLGSETLRPETVTDCACVILFVEASVRCGGFHRAAVIGLDFLILFFRRHTQAEWHIPLSIDTSAVNRYHQWMNLLAFSAVCRISATAPR